MNYSVKINLNALRGARVGSDNEGKKYVSIPLEENGIFEGKKGLYLDAIAFEMKVPKYGNTHIVSRKLTKSEMSLSVEEKRDIPMLGTLGEPYESRKEETRQPANVGTMPTKEVPKTDFGNANNGYDLPF